MTYLQFLLVVHVLGGRGRVRFDLRLRGLPSDAEGLEPAVRAALADISYRFVALPDTRHEYE